MANELDIASSLSRYYAEALVLNPKATVYENMLWAVKRVPSVAHAHDTRNIVGLVRQIYEEGEFQLPELLVEETDRVLGSLWGVSLLKKGAA